MSLVSVVDGELAFGDVPLLDKANLGIDARERIGLIGRNGTGKSSLLTIIAGLRELDDGECRIRDATRVVYVEQEPELPEAIDLRTSLALRMGMEAEDTGEDPQRWATLARLDSAANQLDLPLDNMKIDALSGGERKRAALAAALATEPDLLLLDEPTNHLDIAAIEKLERLLVKGPTVLVITHDRHFLDQVATRIIELDRGMLRSYPGNFTAYEKRKAEQLAEETEHKRKFDKFWKQEEVWIRQGVQARRTRNEGRVRRLEALRKARSERRERIGSVSMSIDSSKRSGKLVAELENVSKLYPATNPQTGETWQRKIVDDFSTIIQRGDRIGFIGPNGAGKTTLLKLITGAEAPDKGTVKLGTKLEIAYFDQMRAQLDPEKTLTETISPGSDWIEIGESKKHVVSYLGDFLFSPRRAASPVKTLSGGERNRLLLARLFARPANVLVLDEPTNDLDIESLEILESTLHDYAGTLLIVSHDRAFLDAIVTQTIAFEGDGKWREYPGGYEDWVRQRKAAPSASTAGRAAPAPARKATKSKPKLSYKDKRELETLPDTIAALETEQAALHERMASPEYFQEPAATQTADNERSQQIESELLEKFDRWEKLEAMANT
jgi:ATP-binding cassette subfamily F protein uup